MTESSSSYDWLREIKSNLKQLDSIPLTGAHPPFPWEDFSARLSQSFDRKNIHIQPGEISWTAKEDLYEGMGETPFCLAISVPPISGHVCWVMPEPEIAILAARLLTKESHPLPLHDKEFTQSFYHFLAIEALYHFTEVGFDQTLSPVLTTHTTPPNQDSLSFSISLRIDHHTTRGRLIISPEFRKSWVEHFAKREESSILTDEMARLAHVTVHLEAGKTELNLAQWMSVQCGDFLTLDSCSLDPVRLDGRVMLTINGKPTFRAKLKDETLKILELPLLHEVETPMAKKIENEDDFSDLDLPDDHDDSEEHEDDDLFSETDDDLFEEDSEESQTQTDSTAADEDMDDETSKKTSSEAPHPSSSIDAKRLICPKEIPVTVVVEVGQVNITMDQLLKLEPGNLLNVNLDPENGVDLTINGKKVGKGELVRIGDIIGVRILELGHQS